MDEKILDIGSILNIMRAMEVYIVESFNSNATMFGVRVSDQTIVEYINSIPEQSLTYSTENYAYESPYVFAMRGMYNDRFYDFSLSVDELPLHMKMMLFNHATNFYNYFRKKDITLLNFILSTDRIEYPHRIPMLETYDFDTSKSLMSWMVSTNRVSESVLGMLGDEYNFYRDISAQDRKELKRNFWESAFIRNGSTSFHTFPMGDYNNIQILNNIFPLFDRYNAIFGKDRIESDGWTDEDIDVMVEFVKKHEVSPYFIAHDSRGSRFNGSVKVYIAALEAGDNFLKYREAKKSRTFVNWNIPKSIYENRDFSNFMNKMKLKYGVE
jgi:hypothetical protein